MSKYYETCPYCDTSYKVDFDDEDSIVIHCPACGEEVPEDEEDEIDMDPDGGFWDD